MPVYGVPRDLRPHGLSFEAMVLGNPAYAMGAFDAYVDTSRDYSTWFVKSSLWPIIGDFPISGGRMLGGVICAQVATRAEWRTCAKAVEARVTKLEALSVDREAHIQKETTRALAREREIR